MRPLNPFEIIATMGMAVGSLILGFVSLMRPERIQKYGLEHSKRFYFWSNPFLGWMKTPGYLRYVQFMGVVLLCFGTLILLILLQRFR